MESKWVVARPEPWLEIVLDELEPNRQRIKEGVLPFATQLLGSVECRDIPHPETAITKEGSILLDWNAKNGDRLFIGFLEGKPIRRQRGKDLYGGRWRYILKSLHHKDQSIHHVRKDHVDKIREIFEEMFMVNSVEGRHFLRDYREGLL
jgi:hypothetical protein